MNEMQEVLSAPLFIEGAGFSSRLTMVNELNFAITAEVILSDADGARITSQVVPFTAHSQQALLVGDLLRQAGSGETVGSIKILPDPAKVVSMALAAQLSITGSGASIGQHVEEEFLMVGTQGSGTLRSAGGSLIGSPSLAVQNTGHSAQSATITCIVEKGPVMQQQVQIPAGGSTLLQSCISSSNSAVKIVGDVLTAPPSTTADLGAFGISVTGSGQPGTLAVFGFSWHGTPRGPTLSSQNFVDAGLARSGNTVFTGVPVGATDFLPGATFTPQVAVTNFGSRPTVVSVLFARTDASGTSASQVAKIGVPATTTETIALPPLTGDPELRNSLVVRSDAAPGDVAASVVSVGSAGFDLVEQIGKDQQTPENGGGHPWDVSGGQDSVLLLFNNSAAPKYFNVKIGNGRVLWQQAWQLASLETRAVSIRELIADQVKDRKGAVLPMTLTLGEVSWFNPNPAEGKGRLMQVDATSQIVAGNKRVSRNFSCGYNFVLCGAYLYTDSIIFGYGTSSSPLSLGEVEPMICTAWNPNTCSGQSYSNGGSGYNYFWESNNTSIATVYGSTSSATAMFWGAGVGIGGATGFAESTYCDQGAGGTPTVTPSVTVTPGPTNILGFKSGGPQPAQSTCVNISASGQPSGGTFSWSTSSGAVTLNNASTSTVQVCSVSGQQSASAGDVPISVKYTSSSQSASASSTVTVLMPTTLPLTSDTGNLPSSHTCIAGPGTSSCATSYYSDTAGSSYKSYLRTRTYTVKDQFGNQITLNMAINESYSPAGQVIIGSGIGALLTDCFYYCAAACRTGGSSSFSSTQTILLNGVSIATHAVSWNCSGATVN